MKERVLKHPFPQAGRNEYAGMETSFPQVNCNAEIEDFYVYWKEKYLQKTTFLKGGYKVSFNKDRETVSEAIGYGMLIVVQMAGYDPLAKEYFDGLNLFRKSHPSKGNSAFMSWRVDEDGGTRKEYSATDGDLDMAMALLMAAEQWGEDVYRKDALEIIAAVRRSLVRQDASLCLGDWQEPHTVDIPYSTRTSDFEMVSFRAFFQATGDAIWEQVEQRCFDILEQLQRDFSSETGLFPDFAIQREDGLWKPAHAGFLEGKNDGRYGFNACRVPWRIGFSALYSNNYRAKRVVGKLMNWVQRAHTSPSEFKAGYELDGIAVSESVKMVFSAPLGVAAMATGDQTWLDETFRLALKTRDSYYSDSVNMICLLIMSGNYWIPKC